MERLRPMAVQADKQPIANRVKALSVLQVASSEIQWRLFMCVIALCCLDFAPKLFDMFQG
jgi:hypothetical protein